MAQGKIRTFLAIELPDAIKQEAVKLVDDVRSRYPAFRYLPRENWHLTLHFLGDISFQQLESLKDGLRQVSEKNTPFEIRVKGIGGFPIGGKHDLLWLGVIGELEKLEQLHSDL